ncbi:Putative Co/Zn/Cd efflux system membrane fusion protein [Minicystis rosea]|nr:Putative Co/Zn/Cd efflux system membrane fusion protein [Minicystis rosea]
MHRSLAVVVLAVALATGACKPKEGQASEERPPALPVDVVVLQPTPVRDTSEFLASLSSRSSVALYPQIVGHVSKILVKPGDRVKAGAPIVQIDPSPQQATLDQLVATKRVKEVSLRLAGERAKRATALHESGLLSRQDFDQAMSDREAATADLRAAEAQIQAQASQLKFFTIAAPFEGVVGDIPVKLGDLVTTATKVTTVDQNAVLEAYVNVPVERAPDVGADSRVELIDARGQTLGESRVTFVADQANVDTQSVLIKGVFPNATSLRAAQLVRARVVWSTKPGILLPTTAVVRQSGQTFAFVAEGEGAAATAKQRAVTLGPIEGNAYVVTAGLKPGERVITSGIQKIREGAPVTPKS